MSRESLASENGTKSQRSTCSQNSFIMSTKNKKDNTEITTMLDGMMTFGKTEGGHQVLDFKATEYVELTPFTATCLVQAMRNGDVFITAASAPATKRNARVFYGRYITVTRRDDGTLRPNFRPMKMEEGFSASSYATGVADELLWALSSLLGK